MQKNLTGSIGNKHVVRLWTGYQKNQELNGLDVYKRQVYEGGKDFPKNHEIELKNVRFSYDGKTDVLQGVNPVSYTHL